MFQTNLIADFESEDTDTERLNINEKNKKTISVKVRDFEQHIFQKAINIKAKSDRSLLRFELLKEELEIDSIEDFRSKIIGNFEIKLILSKKGLKDKKDKTIFEEYVTNREKLDVLVKSFDVLLVELKQNIK